MSRRHGRTHHHERGQHGAPRPGPSAGPRPAQATEGGPGQVAPPPVAAERAEQAQPPMPSAPATVAPTPTPTPTAPVPVPTRDQDSGGSRPSSAADSASVAEAAPAPTIVPAAVDAATGMDGPATMEPRPPALDGGSPGIQGPSAGPRPFNGAGGRPNGQNGQNGHNGQNGQNGQSGQNGQNGAERGSPCTAPQLRRFIKSRPYVPMHELRRRFSIEGTDDDVSQIQLDPGCIFIGLPAREGQLLGELLRAGEIGYELSLDPRSPIVVGVYPMRPVPRP